MRKRTDKDIASTELERGPARDIRAESRLGLAKLYGSKRTGFAQPKTIGNLNKIKISGNKTVPMISIWARGLRESLPASLAVGSPSLSAIQA